MSATPLKGLKVIELQAIGPVPFVGRQLQQLGAEVVRICPLQDRGIGIAIDRQADVLNHGKLERRIDLKDPTGVSQLHKLLTDSDVLTEGFRPGVLERLGLEPVELCKQHPKLVIGRLSGFGRHGPYAARAGHDINYLALSGALAAIGTEETPVVPLNLIADFGGGAMYLLNGILAKLVERSLSHRGGVVDTSILAGTVGLTTMMHGLLAGGRWVLRRQQNLLDGAPPFYRVYSTLDKRFIAVGALEPSFFRELLKLTGLQAVIPLKHQYQSDQWSRMTLLLSQAFATRTRDQWASDAELLDCCVTPVLDFSEAATHPHNQANHWFNPEPFAHPDQLWQFSA